MGFNYKWFKAGATTLPEQRVYNRFFKKGMKGGYSQGYVFHGLHFTRKIADYVKKITSGGRIFADKHRFYPLYSMTGNIFKILITFAPIGLGGSASVMCAVFALPAMYSVDADYPWWFLVATLSWNFFFLNMFFVFNLIFSRYKGAYIDREKQTISFTWRVKGKPQKNEFGHATFPLSDMEAFYSMQLKNQYGGSTHALCIAHKDHATYSGAFLQTSVKDNPHNPNFCRMEWELIQRFADNSLPLPDMPDLEAYRHLDPVTVKYDQQHSRPERYWRDMHIKQQRAIERELEEKVYTFPFSSALSNPKHYAQKELEKPWLTWSIEQKYFQEDAEVPIWRKRANVIFSQLTIGL
ncbi:hypothetical protein GCM10009111_25870 [Colwellia asteriadis]|uniref:Transmembrane protein n=1 Tax=Colwellia asteriadis TaxID=517723 RepID=A0ABP3WIA1_9GAMM